MLSAKGIHCDTYMMPNNRLKDRIALITGASRGIGSAIAKRFAQEGAHTVLTARTVGGLEDTDDSIRKINGTESTLVPLDLADGDTIDQLGAALYERFGRIDIVIGNAGTLGELTPVHHLEPTTWDNVIALNVTANYRLIRSMDPLLKASDAGRAIFVTSRAAIDLNPFWGGYAASKAALEALIRTYAQEVQHTNVRVNLVDPGRQRTSMRAKAFPGENPKKLRRPEEMTGVFVDLAEADFEQNGKTFEAYPEICPK
ncbi:MAG: SDR family NAD(P)-dependent oxidoreductase [Pseudomonadota bacterium]|nr:SDR family NAD(P)-dependent oxidoreductase [Pseudomonadota bacterium]